jgi:hypothetical protein
MDLAAIVADELRPRGRGYVLPPFVLRAVGRRLHEGFRARDLARDDVLRLLKLVAVLEESSRETAEVVIDLLRSIPEAFAYLSRMRGRPIVDERAKQRFTTFEARRDPTTAPHVERRPSGVRVTDLFPPFDREARRASTRRTE